MTVRESVWVFNGCQGGFPSGIFTELDRAEQWIRMHGLTGTLTAYPLDTGVYDWATNNRIFSPKKPHQTTPQFIGRFTSASMEHYHYENGQRQI